MPPSNSEYMIAAYVIGGVIVLAYSAYLFFTARKLK